MKRNNIIKDEWPQLLILLIPFVLLAIAWDQLPERLPTHWGFNGRPNGYTTKGIGFFLVPMINVCLAAVLFWLANIDPKVNRMNVPGAPVKSIRLIITTFLTAVSVLIVLPPLGMNVDVGIAVQLGLPLLFLLTGIYFPTLQPNYFIGIRAPWTLESPENWRLTHIFGGKLWVIASAIYFVLQFFIGKELRPAFLLTYLCVIVIPPLVYSFLIFQKSKRA